MKTQTHKETAKESGAAIRTAVRYGLTALVLCAGTVRANNIKVTNVTWVNTVESGQSDVSFDLSWQNSWRAAWLEPTGANVTGSEISVTNWDAVWVFVKFRLEDSVGGWQHATLSTNAADHVKPVGAAYAVDVGLTGGKGVGVFVYRNSVGYGNVSFTNVTLRWHHGGDFVKSGTKVDVAVNAIEMVYVADGPFTVGSGGTESGCFTEGNAGTTWTNTVSPSVPFQITSEDALGIGNEAGKLWGTANSGNTTVGGAGTLSNAFPKGYAAFYCMKYEITQGQYTDFMNLLQPSQAGNRYASTWLGTNRFTIGTNTAGVYTNGAPDRACNFLSWADGAAFADWAGLRPMTELEFEKACRGPLTPVPNEYAWGLNTIMVSSKTLSGIENGTETVTSTVSAGAAHYGDQTIIGGSGGKGPLRAGIFATGSSLRQTAGASYWGIMELSGNLWERPVSVGTGRLFTGLHGDGYLSPLGDSDVLGWPGTNAAGASFRGGNWMNGEPHAQVSDRRAGASTGPDRTASSGWRAVRAAPPGMNP